MKATKKVDVIVDMQFGSTGKGLIAGYLAEKYGHDVVMTANMPNAGHTYINAEGRKWVHKALPSGITTPNLKYVMIGAGAVFDPERLIKEVTESCDIIGGRGAEVLIHECATVLMSDHKKAEEATMSHLSSTMQGSAIASIAKMMRNPDSSPLARDWFPQYIHVNNGEFTTKVRIVTQAEWLDVIYKAKRILAEGAQGYSLGLNAGMWPYCTSRDCTPTRFLADMGIPLTMVKNVVGTMRCHPIRVGNTADGFSGPAYPDQTELKWGEGQLAGIAPETTTVTGRIRRVFTFSAIQAHEAVLACAPTHIFLNFCNYDEQLAEAITKMMWNDIGSVVAWTGHGPTVNDVNPTTDTDDGF